MKKSKRLLSFILAGIMTLMMCACGGEEDLKAYVETLAENTVAGGAFSQNMDVTITLTTDSEPDEAVEMTMAMNSDFTDYDPNDLSAMKMTGTLTMDMLGESAVTEFICEDGKMTYVSDDPSLDGTQTEVSAESMMMAESIIDDENVVYERNGDAITFSIDVTDGALSDLMSAFGSDVEDLGIEMGDFNITGEITESNDMIDTITCNCKTSMTSEGETLNMDLDFTIKYSK